MAFMDESTRVSVRNRTGMKMSPQHGRELLESIEGEAGIAPPPAGDGAGMSELRLSYIEEADSLGSIPPPTTAKGMAQAGMKWLKGQHPEVFLDKLAERAAFERSGARLYDGLLSKLIGDSHNGSAAPRGMTEQRVLEIRTQEEMHLHMVTECIEELGGDPTAQTPSADLVGVESLGLVQAISDPRTTLVQSLHTTLTAEMVDVAGWELLAQMAEGLGRTEMQERFLEALSHEEEHLISVREWYTEMTLKESGGSH